MKKLLRKLIRSLYLKYVASESLVMAECEKAQLQIRLDRSIENEIRALQMRDDIQRELKSVQERFLQTCLTNAELAHWIVEFLELLDDAEQWMTADGCDCGTDEPGTCSLCRVRKGLADFKAGKRPGIDEEEIFINGTGNGDGPTGIIQSKVTIAKRPKIDTDNANG
jgi:hypothetical protein